MFHAHSSAYVYVGLTARSLLFILSQKLPFSLVDLQRHLELTFQKDPTVTFGNSFDFVLR